MKFAVLLVAGIAGAISIPDPTGKFSVAYTVLPMTDPRLDPYAPTPQPRKILTSLFLPIAGSCPKESIPYMTPAIAAGYGQMATDIGLPNDLFSKFTMDVCKRPSTSCRKRKYPVAIFSPGLGNSRLIYNARIRDLASRGYVVVSIDHTYDATTEFPDGTVIPGLDIDEDDNKQVVKNVQVRKDDISFVISQLQNKTAMDPILRQYAVSLDTKRLVVYGHSLGGAAAATIASSDIRVLGGVNHDGRMVDPILSSGLSKPFMQVGRRSHDEEDPTWNQFWPRLAGKKIELAINQTQHGTFEDFPILLSLLNLPPEVQDVVNQNLGNISVPQMNTALNSAMVAFMDFVFYHQDKALKKLGSLPQVSIVRSSL